MESGRESVVKKFNGHGAGLVESGRPPEVPQTPHSELVDELAQAMKMARESLVRANTAPSLTAASAPQLPTMPAPRGLFDDEEDDAAMPIPSTWRTPPEPPKTSSVRAQVRAGVLGFATGLAVIVPAVLFLTGRLGDLSLDSLFGSNGPVAQLARSGETTNQSALRVQQRTVSTTLVAKPQSSLATTANNDMAEATITPASARQEQGPLAASFASTSAAAIPAAQRSIPVATPVIAKAEAPAEPEPSWSSAVAEGKELIQAGNIAGARKALEPAADANEPEAIMALAETYDPNLLAAWGVRDVTADVQRARELYQKALDAGLEPARTRLMGLN